MDKGQGEPFPRNGAEPRAVVIMGVSGSGKSTVAELLAKDLGWEMMEGDRLHPPANVEKMRQGVPLTDADRLPWLDRLGEELRARAAAGRSVVATCSALKRAYRARILAARPDARFVFLKGSEGLIAYRLSARHHEYMPASLLRSQIDTLEEPSPDEPAITVDAGDPPDALAGRIVEALGLASEGSAPSH
jgi:carbohydrate kinase (thermoresistant glucokinase family)